MASIIPLAFAAALYPTLLAGVIVILARERPALLLAGFLAGGVAISVGAGLIIVFALRGAVSTKNQKSASPTVDVIAGILSLALAGVLLIRGHKRRSRSAQPPEPNDKGPSWTQRMLGGGSWWAAFGAGLVLNIPGIWYLDALKDIAEAKEGAGVRILWILVFIAIMFILAEVPLVGFLVSPEATRVRVTQVRGWMSEHAHSIAVGVAGAVGAYLSVKGIVGLS